MKAMKNWKLIFGLLLSAAVFTACSDDDTPFTPVDYDVVSFEKSEGMLDAAEMPIGDLPGVEITGFQPGTFDNVLCAKDYMMEEDFNGNYFDGLLFSTADGMVGFGSYFTDFSGSQYGANDTWGGFVLSQNFSKTATGNGQPDYENDHFSAWTTKGANGTETFALAYCNGYGVYDYHTPRIEFEKCCTVGYIYMANATVTAQYASPKGKDYYFKVVVTGYSHNKKGKSVEHTLISGTNAVPDWVKVDLTPLGEVAELRFEIETNDKSGIYPNCPSYFCIDEIGLVKPAK